MGQGLIAADGTLHYIYRACYREIGGVFAKTKGTANAVETEVAEGRRRCRLLATQARWACCQDCPRLEGGRSQARSGNLPTPRCALRDFGGSAPAKGKKKPTAQGGGHFLWQGQE